jgi:hypothetical protein
MDKTQFTKWYINEPCPRCNADKTITDGEYRWCGIAHCKWTNYPADNLPNHTNKTELDHDTPK